MVSPRSSLSVLSDAIDDACWALRAVGKPICRTTYSVDAQELARAVAHARQRRVRAADMLTVDEAANLANARREELQQMIGSCRAIGLDGDSVGTKLPSWQFDPPVWAALQWLARELGSRDGWALLAFLEAPLSSLEGRTPRAALEQGEHARVRKIARHHV